MEDKAKGLLSSSQNLGIVPRKIYQIGVARATIAQNDGFEQRRPPQAVDVINVNIGFQQFSNDFDMPPVSR